ncbi:MAG: hypothetical protein ACXVCP_09540 [Bdellovibrio sp.]
MKNIFSIFKIQEPVELSKLENSITKSTNPDTLHLFLSSAISRLQTNEIMTNSELQLILDWLHNLSQENVELLQEHLENNLVKSPSYLDVLTLYFKDLTKPNVLELLLKLSFFRKNLNHKQQKSFDTYLKNNYHAKKGDELIDYIDNLSLDHAKEYTSGQKITGEKHLYNVDFLNTFENSYEILNTFLIKLGFNSPETLIPFLDRIVFLNNDEGSLTAKVYNPLLGYHKYVGFVEINSNKVVISNLHGYLKLKQLISKFEDSVEILSQQEYRRGAFWKEHLNQMESILYQRANGGTYKIAVAFIVGKFAICDYGPVGNPVYVYDKDVFLNLVKPLINWRSDDHLTKTLPSSEHKFNHISGWEEKAKKIIRIARYSYE